jgi:D-alanyl-D-alanine endopeptidase (penicillin-binding protein 7)
MKRILLVLALVLISKYSYAEKITAESWLVANEQGKVIQGSNINEVRSIASITKLMTAIVVLDAKQDLDEFIKPYTRKELIQLSMVRSDNQASEALCNFYPGGKSQCVKAMNAKAQKLGMKNTKFVEPTGLSPMNISTATDLIKLVMASKEYPLIVESSKMSQVKIQLKRKWLVFPNTNPLIGKRHEFIVSKTGWIRASGGCIVMMLDTELGKRIVVVLGSKNTKTRIPEAEFIAKISD